MGAGKPRSAGPREELVWQLESEGNLGAESVAPQGRSALLDEAYPLLKGNLLDSESSDLNVEFIKKKNIFTAAAGLMYDQISEDFGLAKLAQKTNYCIQRDEVHGYSSSQPAPQRGSLWADTLMSCPGSLR